ncbi:MAG: FAD-dependent oxidoreductase [Segniliparus sp.]|uniref:FAD-dependent oxidoreductase n=1 Tax=Segniliparus sp. TaxID=2804064 RepID=UPI003F2B9D3C
MPHVITQSCCSDASCVYACPVNCIHPTPDEPDFLTAEMLRIDPESCVDCGACVDACPAEAIVPDSKLGPTQQVFLELNASYYSGEEPRKWRAPLLARMQAAPKVMGRGAPLRVAVVGSGPAAMYAADELLTQAGVEVNVFDRLPTPYGLVRAGVAPDHQKTKGVVRLFDEISAQEGFNFYLNVEVGSQVTHAELMRHHHAVIYAVGASADRRLDIPGVGLPGSLTATEFVSWANAHPDRSSLPVDLGHGRAVVVGNGNVALDVARLLALDPEALAETDIAEHALAALRASEVREVVVAGRRGPAQSAFTLPELIGLTSAVEVVLDPQSQEMVRQDLADTSDPVARDKLTLLSGLPAASPPAGRFVRLRYRLSPREVLGKDRVEGMKFAVAGQAGTTVIPAGLVLSSIGYRAVPVRDLPFDKTSATVPNENGRVVEPGAGSPRAGAYVAGWIKRGPKGFIGTNKSCSQETARALVDDYNRGLLPAPESTPEQFEQFMRIRSPGLVDRRGWLAVDAAEVARGREKNKVRDKFTAVPAMLAAAAAAKRA